MCFIGLMLFSCGKKSEKHEFKTDEGTVVIEEDGDNVKITTEEGDFSVESTDDGVSTVTSTDKDGNEMSVTSIDRENQPYPESFPKEFAPFVEGNVILSTVERKSKESSGYSILYKTKTDPKEVTEAFKKAYPKNTAMVTNEEGKYDAFISQPERSFIVTITNDNEDKETEVNILIGM